MRYARILVSSGLLDEGLFRFGGEAEIVHPQEVSLVVKAHDHLMPEDAPRELPANFDDLPLLNCEVTEQRRTFRFTK